MVHGQGSHAYRDSDALMEELLEIKTLGGLRIQLGAQPVTGFTSRKVDALLVYLACTGRHQSRDLLADLLWEGVTQERAMGSLRVALHSLRKQLAPYLTVTRDTVRLRSDAPVWLDVAALEERMGAGQIEQALALYEGEFLAGFFVRGARGFSDWVAAERERVHQRIVDVLGDAVERHLSAGTYQAGLRHARKLVQLAPYLEKSHRQLMRLLAYSGHRSAALAQYQACCRALKEELDVPPAEATTALFEQIRAGELEPKTRPAGGETGARPGFPEVVQQQIRSRRPAFLDEAAGRKETARPLFVTRERELSRLDGLLQTALGGEGRVVFVTGGPGRGKTALMREFARRAMSAHPDLLVAGGNCSAYSGVGDPYLPFREVMAGLTGDVEASWLAGAITRAHALRLWDALPVTLGALMHHGPHLVEIFFSGQALLERTAVAAGDGAAWLPRVRDYVERKPIPSAGAGLGPDHVFQQFTNVLHALAQKRPLLLILDDLQWADTASVGLLFHLGRRLGRARVLLLAAYRPEEIALGPPVSTATADGTTGSTEPERHTLAKALGEFKRQYGDVWIELDQVDTSEGRRFVDAALDAEPNGLPESFRRALFNRTQGHPLFTVELLRALRERGVLVQDDDGSWIQGGAVHWGGLPARVEAVISERIDRLADPLRKVLAVASVEGEVFTTQVVARVQEVGERQVLRMLSEELEKRHRLVLEQGELLLGGRPLSRYRFAHVLFQQVLYDGLSKGERRLLHREIAAVLEALYAGHREEIAAQLAHHYALAGDAEAERRYARMAGERAAADYANVEALRHLSRALELTPETDRAARFDLLLTREEVNFVQGDPDGQLRDLAALEKLAEALGDADRRVQVALRKTRYEWFTGDLGATITEGQNAIQLAQLSQNVRDEARAHFLLGRALWFQGDLEDSQTQLERARSLARDAGSRRVEADSLRFLSNVFLFQDIGRANTYLQEALDIHREIRDRFGEGNALNIRAMNAHMVGDYAGANADLEAGLRISREVGLRYVEAIVLNNLGQNAAALGDFSTARERFQAALQNALEIGERPIQGWALAGLGQLSCHQGEYAQARRQLGEALGCARETGYRQSELAVLLASGRLSRDLGDYASARAYLEQALRLAQETGHRLSESLALSQLGLLSHLLGDDRTARERCERARQVAQAIQARPEEALASTLLGHALNGLALLSGAAEAYREAVASRREMGQDHLAPEPQAGLVRLDLQQGDLAGAQARVEEILSSLGARPLDGTEEPFRIYLTCYRALCAGEGSGMAHRAEGISAAAYGLLQARAATIDNAELRRSYLEDVAVHRAIVEVGKA
jgi:adenylate cyclase